MYTEYEKQAQNEIIKWRDERDGSVTKALRKAGKVVKPVANAVGSVVPAKMRDTIQRSVLGALELMKDGSYWTYRDADVLRVARDEGAVADSIKGLANNDLDVLDRTARRFFKTNKLAAAVGGAGFGFGGWALVALDIPTLFTVSFRAVQQIGASYGFDMQDPEMVHVVMRVFNAGTTAAPEAKAAALFDMHVAAIGMAKNWTYKKTAEKTKTGVALKALKEATKHLPRQISKHVTKRKLAQTVPVAGAGIGGLFNYYFLSNTCRSAYMLFRELYLVRKYGELKLTAKDF